MFRWRASMAVNVDQGDMVSAEHTQKKCQLKKGN